MVLFFTKVTLVSCMKTSLSVRMVYRSINKALGAKGRTDEKRRVHSRKILPSLALCLRFELVKIIAEFQTSACIANFESEPTKLVVMASGRTSDMIKVSSFSSTVNLPNLQYAIMNASLRDSMSVELESLVD